MPLLELTLRCREAEQPRYENALEDVGALAVTLLDADVDTPNEHAILEPGVGETPLWGEIVLSALFPHDADALLLLAALDAFDPALDWTQRALPQRRGPGLGTRVDGPVRAAAFGARTWIVPWNRELPRSAQRTTRRWCGSIPAWRSAPARIRPPRCACNGWMRSPKRANCDGRTVLDFGCGSGILALAALKLGAARAVGVDNDPQALHRHARQRRAQRRRRPPRTCSCPHDEPSAQYPIVVANILASALDALADTLAARVAPGGRIALSGILAGQEDALLDRYGAWFDALAVAQEGDWIRIDGVRGDLSTGRVAAVLE